MIYLRLHVGRSLRCNTNARHWNVFIVPLFPLWIIGAFCVKDIPISHIVALVGDPTYLPCDISTTHEGDSVHLVLWYREDLGTSVYSVDARDRDFGIAERWSDDTVFSNRAYFMPDKKPAELGVDHIREEDAGIYRCRVDFQIGQTRNSKVNLTVIVPPHKIVIVDDSGIARNSMVGPYIEGDTLRLYCDVYGGKYNVTSHRSVFPWFGREGRWNVRCNSKNEHGFRGSLKPRLQRDLRDGVRVCGKERWPRPEIHFNRHVR